MSTFLTYYIHRDIITINGDKIRLLIPNYFGKETHSTSYIFITWDIPC